MFLHLLYLIATELEIKARIEDLWLDWQPWIENAVQDQYSDIKTLRNEVNYTLVGLKFHPEVRRGDLKVAPARFLKSCSLFFATKLVAEGFVSLTGQSPEDEDDIDRSRENSQQESGSTDENDSSSGHEVVDNDTEMTTGDDIEQDNDEDKSNDEEETDEESRDGAEDDDDEHMTESSDDDDDDVPAPTYQDEARDFEILLY